MAADPTTRRAAVAAALGHAPGLSVPQRQRLAAQFGCSPTTIYRDVRALRPAPPTAPHAAAAHCLQVAADDAQGRDVALLRLLGRLEYAPTPVLQQLIAPDVTQPALQMRLQRLYAARVIGRQAVPMAVVTPPEAGGRRGPPPRAPYVWWLTPKGRDRVAALEVEPDAALDALQVHRWDEDIAREQLTHDLRVTAWCASVIAEVRRCRRLAAVLCQVEYVSTRYTLADQQAGRGAAGKEQQRLDALLILVFARTPQPQLAHPWTIPWYTGSVSPADDTVVRFALEVDRGTEALKILLGKALTYRTLSANGHYARTLGGDVLPVVLAPTARRAGQIAREWQHAWPGGAGVSSTFRKAIDPAHGALWGQYLTLTDVPARPAPLLGALVPDVATWRAYCTAP